MMSDVHQISEPVDEIQEVEIESIPCDLNCETVETTIIDHHNPMIAQEIILATQEEIVGGVDPLSVYDQIPVPDQNDVYIESSPGPSNSVHHVQVNHPQRRQTSGPKKARKSTGSGGQVPRFRAQQQQQHQIIQAQQVQLESLPQHHATTIFGEIPGETKARKWEQKQVQIKTLEGEFSVTMWASGTDDGRSLIFIVNC